MFPLELSLVFCCVAFAVALVRARPCLSMAAGNQAIVLRALLNIRDYGQPESQAPVPPYVFGSDQITTAANLMAFASLVIFAFALIPEAVPPAGATRRELPRLPKFSVVLLFVLLGIFVASTKTILQGGYADPDREVFYMNVPGGALVLAYGLVIYLAVRWTRTGTLSALKAFGVVFAVCFFTSFLKGHTGAVSGVLLTAGCLILREEPRVSRRALLLGATVALVVVVGALIRTVRVNLYDRGGAAVASFADELASSEAQKTQTGEGVESMANGAQYAAHILECVTLWDRGVSRGWKSIYLPLEYTLKPSFFIDLGIVPPRSQEAAWELGEYFIQNGGIYTVGEYYWNGGWPCVLIVFCGVALFMFKCDTTYYYSTRWLVMMCAFAPGLLMGFGYGFAQIARGAINGVWWILAFGVLGYIRSRRGKLTSADPGAHLLGSPIRLVSVNGGPSTRSPP